MERDRQVSVVVAPQLVKQHLGLRARIDEDQRHAVGVDRPIDFGQRVARRVPGPGQLGIRLENSDVGPGPLARHHDLGQSRGLLTSMRHQKGGKLERPCHRGRQADRREFRRQRAEPRQIERQKIAALAGGERVQLIEDDEFEASEQLSRALVRQHQRDLLRRGQQNIGRQDPLAGAARGRRVAGAGLELDRQPHLRHRHGQIARDVDRQRLERRDIERVDRSCRLAFRRTAGEIGQARQEAGQRLAAAGRRDQQRVAPGARVRQQLKLMGMRVPAARLEPAGKGLGQRRQFVIDDQALACAHNSSA